MKYLNEREMRALNRLGDLMLPRCEGFPSFSELGCIACADDILSCAPEADRNSLKSLLRVLAPMPAFVLRTVVWLTQHPAKFPEPIASLCRQLDLGLRSVIVSCYYSGEKASSFSEKSPWEVMGYNLNIVLPKS